MLVVSFLKLLNAERTNRFFDLLGNSAFLSVQLGSYIVVY